MNIAIMKPYGDQLIVSTSNPNITPIGLYMPENSKPLNGFGTVVSLGLDHSSGRKKIPFKKGDTVFFQPYNGLKLDDTHILLRDIEIIGYIERNIE